LWKELKLRKGGMDATTVYLKIANIHPKSGNRIFSMILFFGAKNFRILIVSSLIVNTWTHI
jgi:hypothetical protein